MAKRSKRTVDELEDEIKLRGRRIEELRKEIDEQRDLIKRLEELAEDNVNIIEAWKETFDMTITENGGWTWRPFWEEHNTLVDQYNDLARRWNKWVPFINGKFRDVGRPLAASESQVIEVQKLRRGGRSLRGIAEDTSLGLDTVRTIVSKMHGRDRTTKKHRGRLERIEIDRAQIARWKRQRRNGDTVPKRAQGVVEASHKLIKEAKGLGRS